MRENIGSRGRRDVKRETWGGRVEVGVYDASRERGRESMKDSVSSV